MSRGCQRACCAQGRLSSSAGDAKWYLVLLDKMKMMGARQHTRRMFKDLLTEIRTPHKVSLVRLKTSTVPKQKKMADRGRI